MPVASILTSFNKSIREIGILSSYMTDCASLESKYQYFISEVVMLRLFAILEMTICEIALKLACNAPYKNGSLPLTLVTCKTIKDAHFKMLTHKRGGKKKLLYLKWTNSKNIEKNIQFTLDLTDKFFTYITYHSSLIDEMRSVRNHIAHRNSNTASKYYNQLQLIYGGNLRLHLGAFLTSTKRHSLSNLERYLISVPVILHDITNG